MVEFLCLDCGIDTLAFDELYQIHDELWLKINPQKHGMLCVGCCETRLGRQLQAGDFPKVELNWNDKKYPKSSKLLWRMI